MTAVIDGLAQLLEDRGVAAWDPSGLAYDGSTPATFELVVPATPDRIVVLSLYGGADANGEESRNPWREPRLQVRTRAGQDPRDALQLDADVHAVLHTLGPIVLSDGTDLSDCYSLQSTATSLGQDANGRWEFSRNYQLTINT